MGKFEIEDIVIPMSQRKEINNKILYIINNNLSEKETGISKNDIFNAYTGDGGLHGLQFKDYANYQEFKIAKQDFEHGQFFTPYRLCQWIYDCLHISTEDLVADLNSGHGAFINSAPNEQNFYGCELDIKAFKVAQYLYPDAHLKQMDIRSYETDVFFRLCIRKSLLGKLLLKRWGFLPVRILLLFKST